MKNLGLNFKNENQFPKRFRNKLYQYKGGGYDVCFWEWNYFVINQVGDFINIASSGYKGISCRDKCIDFLQSIQEERAVNIYNLKSKYDCENFTSNTVADHVISVFKFLEECDEIYHTWELSCPNCGLQFDADQFILIDPRGACGVAIQHDGFVCMECHSLGCCINCEEYMSEESLTYGYCEYCFKEQINSFSLKNEFIYIDFDSTSNSFYVEEFDFNLEVDDFDNLWIVKIHDKEGFKNFIVDANSEYNAIDYVSHYLNGNYYTANAKEFKSEILENI